MSRTFVTFVPQDSRLGMQMIQPSIVLRIRRNIEHSERLTDLYLFDPLNDSEPQWMTVMHPLESVLKTLDIEVVPAAAAKPKK